MKKNTFKPMLLSAGFLLVSFFGFAQDDTPKPIKKIKVFNESQLKSMASPQLLFNEEFKLADGNEFLSTSLDSDALGFVHQKFQQYFKGYKVEFGQTVLHAKNGLVVSMSNNVFKIEDASITPAINAMAALNSAKNFVGADTYLWELTEEAALSGYSRPEGELVMFPALDKINENPVLAYKFDIYAASPVYRADVYINAQTGAVLFENKKIHHADTPATGVSLYDGTVSFTADSFSGSYRLRQAADGNGIRTYDMNNGTNYSAASDVTSADTSFPGSTATGVQAHYGAEQTHKYFLQKHGRNSYNNAGAIINSYVSYSNNYVNAFWDGSRMTYGDGDGVSYGPLVSLDIVGHEIGHGVTEYSANLVYSYESGALNESFSDIFGESIEFFAKNSNDWLMGDEIGAGGSGGAIRSISNPNAFGQPDTYLGTDWYSGSGDNGGVHYNSGVQNFWWYLLSVGGSGTNDNGDAYSVSAIGMEKASAIAYRNLTVYLGVNSQYSDARDGAVQSAIDLYGADSPEHQAVENAWHAVGIGLPYGGVEPPLECVENEVTLTITFDNYPEETAWTLTDSGGSTVASASYSTANPDGSTVNVPFGTLADDTYTFTITDSYGDGICCAYGSGSYSLSNPAGVMFSGGSFGSSEATDFCIESGGGADTEAPSIPINLSASGITDTSVTLDWNDSTDNVAVDGYEVFENGVSLGVVSTSGAVVSGLTPATTYTYTVAAYDAAGNTSAQSAGLDVTTTGGGGGDPVEFLTGYFESGWDGWVDGGSDAYRYSGYRSYEGNRSIRIRDNSNSSKMTSGVHDISGYNNIDVEFYFWPRGMETGEDFWVQMYDGSSWQTVASYASGTDFTNNSFWTTSFTISSGSYTFASNAQFRFVVDASANNDMVYFDQITFTGNYTAAAGIIAGNNRAITNLGNPYGFQLEDELEFEGDFMMYPNPVSSQLNVRLLDQNGTETFRIVNLLGQVVKQGTLLQAIDVSNLQSGVYVLEINDGEETITDRFIKQ
ncbi:MAG: M4 family metallopeptidase [Gilvibacter sp.]